jgi:DNA-binding CsgD family transcriptional regulator
MFSAVLDGSGMSTASLRPSPHPAAAGRWPLHGRATQLERALEALEAGRGCVLVGDPGVGKTRLAEEIVQRAGCLGHPVRWVLATQAARTIAFGAVAHLLPDQDRGGATPLSLLQRALHALADLGEGDRLVLGVDDAHLLDDSSSALIHLSASTSRVLVVATVRAGEQPPEPVTALWKEWWADRIEVGPLDRSQTAELAQEILGGEIDQQTEHLLWQVTVGNPLYLRELLLSGLDGGRLRRWAGQWRWRGPLRAGPRLAEVVGSRLADLGVELRWTLEVLAVAQRIELSLAERLCGRDQLHEAALQGAIAVTRDGRRKVVELAHPLYAEVVREAIPEQHAEWIMGNLATALEATGCRRRDDLLRSCDWRLQARLPVPDDALLAGAVRAREAGDWRLAQRLLAAVTREGASNEARFVLGDALLSVGRSADAAIVLDGLDVHALDSGQAAEATALMVDNLAFRLGRTADARHLLDRLEAATGGPAHWQPYCRAQLALAAGDVSSARAAFNTGDGAEPPPWALPALAATAAYSGDIERALALLDRALMAETTAMATRQGILAARMLYAILGGRLEQAPVERIYAASLPGEDRPSLWFNAAMSGQKALVRGDAAAARRWASEIAGLATASRAVDRPALAVGHAVRARLLALIGERREALAALAEMESARRQAASTIDGELARARCAVAAVDGDLVLARTIALEAADRALELGQVAIAVVHACDAARHGDVAGAAARVRDVASGLTGPLLPAMAAHVLAWARADPAGLDAASQAYAAAGAYLLAAEAAAVATRMHREAGARTAAALLVVRSAEFGERCAGCRSPILDRRPCVSPLTPRELQVARLAARGLRNRQIAVELGISTRTVETHVQHAYGKLGVADRSLLARALGDTQR